MKFFESVVHTQEYAEEIETDFAAPRVKPEFGTQSAPIFAENVLDPSARLRKLNSPMFSNPLHSRTNYSYKLPTPTDDKNSNSAGTDRSPQPDKPESKSHMGANLWHSSPLVKDFKPSSLYSRPVKIGRAHV